MCLKQLSMFSLILTCLTGCGDIPPLVTDHSIDLCVSGIAPFKLQANEGNDLTHNTKVNMKVVNCQLNIKCGVPITHPEQCHKKL